MALTLTARQTRLVEGSPLQAVYLHTLTTYTNQTAKSVDTVRYFADRPLTYDYGNSGTAREFLPYVVSTSRQHVEAMPHLPSGGSIEGELLRDYTITLRNVTPQGQSSLIADLRDELFEFSTLEVAELFLDPAAQPDEDPATLNGDEHIVIFRGELDGQPREIDAETITLRFVTERFENVLPLPVSGPTIAPRDTGKRLPVVYGDVRRVPLLGVVVGAQSTLSQPLSESSTQVSVSEGAEFKQSGTFYVGGERMTFLQRNGDVLQNVVRAVALRTEHSPGEIVVEVPAAGVTYAVGEANKISRVKEVWMRSPETGELFKLNDSGQFIPNDTLSVDGLAISSLKWSTESWADVLQEIVANARVTQQPNFEDPTDEVTTATATAEFDTNKRTIQNNQEGWQTPGKADGKWDTATRIFTYDRNDKDRKLACNANTLPAPNRDPARARLHVAGTVFVSDSNVERAEIRVSMVPPVESDDPMWEGLPAISSDIVGGQGDFSFFGAWADNPDRSSTPPVGDSTTDELADHELHVLFRVHEDVATATAFEAEITTLAVEYEYVTGGSLIPITSAVKVAGFSGGAGVELYADVTGPTVPASSYVLGYDFPAAESWADNEATASDVAAGVKLTSDTTEDTIFSLISDASNWTSDRKWLALSDEASAPAGMSDNCLKLNLIAYEEVVNLDKAKWSGTVTRFDDATGGNRSFVENAEGATEYTESTSVNFNTGLNTAPHAAGTVDCTNRYLHFPYVSALVPSGRSLGINPLEIRVGSSAGDYWTFSYNLMSTGLGTGPINLRMTSPTADLAYLSTTGSPDVAKIDRVRLTFTTPAGGVNDYGLSFWSGRVVGTGLGRILPANLPGGGPELHRSAIVQRNFTPQNWSNKSTVRFLIRRNPATSSYVSQLEITFGNSFLVLIYKVPIQDIPEDTPTLLEFNFASPQDDPYFFFQTGLFVSTAIDFMKIEIGSDWVPGSLDLASNAEDGVFHLEQVESSNSPGTEIFAQVAPAAATDLDNTSADYELDFLVRSPQAVGAVAVKFSNETPVYPAAPAAYRSIMFTPSDYEDGVLNTAVRFTATDVGTPTNLDDVKVVRVEIDDEVAGGFEIELHALRVSDDSSDYKAVEGATISHPADVVRHILRERLAVNATSLDSSFEEAETNLGDNQVSAVLGELGGDFYEIMGRLGFEHRFQLVSEEAAAQTIYRLLTAKADYTYQTNTEAEIDRWSRVREVGRGRLDFGTRFRTLFDVDRSLEVPELSAGYLQALRVDVERNDISAKLATAELITAEVNYGVRNRALVALNSVADSSTAIDREAYFVAELIRSDGREYALEGVPALQAYTRERGDIIRLTPPWLGAPVFARVLQRIRRRGAGALTFDLRAVEVSVT